LEELTAECLALQMHADNKMKLRIERVRKGGLHPRPDPT